MSSMNNDLISRSKAKEEIMNWARVITNPKMLSADDTMYVLDNLPAVDAEPVKHSKYVWDDNAMDWNLGAWVCSKCGGRNENIHARKPNGDN